MLNKYIPLKKLGHKLPNGIYYYSFSADPLDYHILGGLIGTNYFLSVKTNKLEGDIHVYSLNYNKIII